MKIEHKKIFRGPLKIFKNISWPINICLKYLMAPQKSSAPLPPPPPPPPPNPTYLMYGPLEDITDKDYEHAQKVWDVFKIKTPGENHDLYVQSDVLLLVDVFGNFRDKCIERYRLNPAHFLSAPGLAWQSCLRKTELELELLTDIDMLLMVKKGIRGKICQAIHKYAKADNKYMNNYDKSIEASYLMCLDANNLYW